MSEISSNLLKTNRDYVMCLDAGRRIFASIELRRNADNKVLDVTVVVSKNARHTDAPQIDTEIDQGENQRDFLAWFGRFNRPHLVNQMPRFHGQLTDESGFESQILREDLFYLMNTQLRPRLESAFAIAEPPAQIMAELQ